MKPEDKLWVEVLKRDVAGEDEVVARASLRGRGFPQEVIDAVFEKHGGLLRRLAET